MQYLICGFMGSGKTTLLNQLYTKFDNYQLIDLDDYIYKKFGSSFLSLSELIETVGWKDFRKMEFDCLQEILEKKKKLVLSLGGGTLTNILSVRLIEDSEAKLVYLKCDFDILWERIKNCEERPLIKEGKEAINKLFNLRKTDYEKADIVLSDALSLLELL